MNKITHGPTSSGGFAVADDGHIVEMHPTAQAARAAAERRAAPRPARRTYFQLTAVRPSGCAPTPPGPVAVVDVAADGSVRCTPELPHDIVDLLSRSAKYIGEAVATGALDDCLDEIARLETDGANRKTVHAAIAARRKALAQP